MKKSITLKHKDGRVVTRESAVQFAKEFGVSKFHIRMVINHGKMYKKVLFMYGWYDPTPLKKPIILLDEHDKRHVVRNVGDFCLQYKLFKPNSLKRFLLGKVPYYYGFRKLGTDKLQKPTKKVYVFQKGKKRVVVEQGYVSKFERENNMCLKKMLIGKTLSNRSGFSLASVKIVEKNPAQDCKLYTKDGNRILK